MTKRQLLSWGRRWHYPQLVLSECQALRCGRASYLAADRVQVRLAARRIACWDAKFLEKVS